MRKKISVLLAGLFIVLVGSCKDTAEQGAKENGNNSFQVSESTNHREPDTGEKAENSLILNGRVGTLSLGERIPETLEGYDIEKSTQTRITEGGESQEIIYTLRENGEKQLILKPQTRNISKADKLIGEIFVLSERFKTQKGIGVGTSLDEFKQVYPNFKIWYTYVSDRYVLETPQLNAQFLLNEADFVGKIQVDGVKVPLKASDFKPGAEIQKIRLYE